MVDRGTTDRGAARRFARWGLLHGPVWGMAAAILSILFVPEFGVAEIPAARAIAVGLVAGAVVGPALGALVGLVCSAADRAPKWLLDAPDYVAVLTIVAAAALVAWPAFDHGDVAAAVGGVLALGAAPAVDAAHSAPELLHPEQDLPHSDEAAV